MSIESGEPDQTRDLIIRLDERFSNIYTTFQEGIKNLSQETYALRKESQESYRSLRDELNNNLNMNIKNLNERIDNVEDKSSKDASELRDAVQSIATSVSELKGENNGNKDTFSRAMSTLAVIAASAAVVVAVIAL